MTGGRSSLAEVLVEEADDLPHQWLGRIEGINVSPEAVDLSQVTGADYFDSELG
jgi:hypothetical protein